MIEYVNDNYDVKYCQRIVNPVQAAAYWAHGARPIDIYLGFKRRWVWVFKLDDVRELYQKWLDHTLD